MRLFQRKVNLILIFLLSIIETFSLGLILSLFAPLFLSDQGIFSATVSHAERLHLLGLAFAITPLAQLFTASFLGQLSDRYGRKVILLISITGSLVSILLLILSIQQHQFFILLISRFMSGIFASNVAVSQAAIADMTEKAKINKVQRFNYLEIGLGLGMLFGPWLGSQLLVWHENNFALPFFYSCILLLIVNLLFACFFKETLLHPDMQQKKYHWYQGLHFLLKACRTKGIRSLLFCWAVFMLGWSLYLKFFTNFLRDGLHLNQQGIGHTYVYMGLLYLACQLFIVMPLAKKIKARIWLMPSMLGVGIFIFLMGFAPTINFLNLAMIGYMLSMAVFLPTFHTQLSNLAHEYEQGAIFGMSVSIHACMNILSGLLGGFLVAWFSKSPLLSAGALICFSCLILKLLAKHR